MGIFLAFINSLLMYVHTKGLLRLRIKMPSFFVFSIFEKLRFCLVLSSDFFWILENTVKMAKVKLIFHTHHSLLKASQVKSENYSSLQGINRNSVQYSNNVLYTHFFPVLCFLLKNVLTPFHSITDFILCKICIVLYFMSKP